MAKANPKGIKAAIAMERVARLKDYQAKKLGEIEARPLPEAVKSDLDKLPRFLIDEICVKYSTGEYNSRKLAKLYQIDESVVRQIIRERGVKVNTRAKEAIAHFDKGFATINEIITPAKPETNKKGGFTQLSKVDGRQSIQLANEIMDIVAQRNPEFARGFQSLAAVLIQKSHELLQAEDLNTGDIKNVASAIKDLDTTMGVFPKQPTIAQQFNFSAKQQEMAQQNQGIKFEIEILDGNNSGNEKG